MCQTKLPKNGNTKEPESWCRFFHASSSECQKNHTSKRSTMQVLGAPEKITLTNLTSEVYKSYWHRKTMEKKQVFAVVALKQACSTMKNTNIILESSGATTSSFHFKSYHETLDGSKLNEIPTTRGNCGLGVQVGCHLFPQGFSENNLTVPLGLSLMPHDMRLNWRFLQAKSRKSARSDVETAFDSMLT